MTTPWGSNPHRRITFSTSVKGIRSVVADGTFTPPSKKASSVFQRVRFATSAVRSLRSTPHSVTKEENRVVFYFTSLHVVRKTFEDCRAVRTILRGFRVEVDERDVSMDLQFLKELKGALGKRQISVPKVFIGGVCLGGAEEIKNLNESGELSGYLEGVAIAETGVCDCCGGFGFVVCSNCHGSHKFHSEKHGFLFCTTCNENGLVRCTVCRR